MAISFRILLLLLHMFLLPNIVRCSSLYAAHHQEDLLDDEEDFITSSEVVEKHTGTSNCSRCSENRERREHRLQSIRIQILNQLGMREAPNITDKSLPHIPPLNHLLDRYSMQADAPHFVPGPEYGDEDDFYIAAEKVLAFAHTPPMLIEVETGDQHLYFKVSSNLQNSQIQSAHLWIYLRPTRHTLHRNITLYQVDRQMEFGQLDFVQLKRKSLDKKNKHGHWVVFDVKKTVNHWMKHPKENLGFVFRSSRSDMIELLGTSDDSSQDTVLLDDQPKQIIPVSEYQKEYTNEGILKEESLIKKRIIPAGFTRKGRPEFEPQAYESSDDIVPDFEGISTTRSAYIPQPNISKLQSYKPFPKTKIFLLEPRMTEVDSYSHSVYCSMPLELTRKMAPTTPLWIKGEMTPLQHKDPRDFISSYQTDYCDIKIQPMKKCLKKILEDKLNNPSCIKRHKEYTLKQDPKCNGTEDEIQHWNYAQALLFRTTYNTAYTPTRICGLASHPSEHPSNKQ